MRLQHPEESHRQNAITWFTLSAIGSLIAVLVGGIGLIAGIVAGILSLVCGGVEMHRYRKAQSAGKIRKKPKLKTRVKKAAKKKANETWHGKKQGGRADYKRKHPKPAQPETTPKGNCSVRCRRSELPPETCECVCGGKRHGELR